MNISLQFSGAHTTEYAKICSKKLPALLFCKGNMREKNGICTIEGGMGIQKDFCLVFLRKLDLSDYPACVLLCLSAWFII